VSGTSRGLTGAAHDGAVGQRDLDELAAVRSVAKRMDGQPDRHAGGERLRAPALAREAVGAIHLDRPLLGASLPVDGEDHPGMGIGPLELLDGPLQGDLPVGIESGKRVMRERRHSVERQNAAEQQDSTGKTECRMFRRVVHQTSLGRLRACRILSSRPDSGLSGS
jgi:hypothetical protein